MKKKEDKKEDKKAEKKVEKVAESKPIKTKKWCETDTPTWLPLTSNEINRTTVSYTHLTLPTTPYV